MMMMRQYQKPKTTSGDLRIPVSFYHQTENPDGEPGQMPTEPVFDCFAQVYGSSNKDNAILDVHGVKRGVTIKVRDTRGEYQPAYNDSVVITDYRYKDSNGNYILWNILDVRPDFKDDRFVIVVLGVTA